MWEKREQVKTTTWNATVIGGGETWTDNGRVAQWPEETSKQQEVVPEKTLVPFWEVGEWVASVARTTGGLRSTGVAGGHTKDVTLTERVQRATTKIIVSLKSVDYETRLAVLHLFPLEYRHL
ncbi:hypothetical protein T265_09509 [Opisthorchis viverrini]|uniref:Uncharacterized protein n=1 Tax=Opisthorchis viverrini TaxID=6198 RepID=A0A074Z5P3_OPIVI|nr:hypothetical protein T265_09509 [Opisthorchis viverrini]KER22393.1 hypothetical protein T265_09509 [Opisthorchis viverrini]